MTTQLTVTPYKWENGCVKGRHKREKAKRKEVFQFFISGSKQTLEEENEFSHFRPKTNNP